MDTGASGSPRPTGGHDPHDAFLSAVGVPLVIHLTTLIRVARTHDVTNEAFQRKLREFMEVVNKALEEEHDITLAAASDYFFLNGVRVRATPSFLSIYHALLGEFERRTVGGIKFVQGVTAAEFERFFQLFMAAEDPTLASRLTDAVEEASVFHVVPLGEQHLSDEETRSLDDYDPTSERGRAKRVFWRAVLGAKKLVLKARQSGRPDLRHAKRLVQPIVDNVLKDEYSIVGMTAMKDHDEYTYAHCVNVSVLAISMGHMLQMERQTLANLGVAALLHDIGKLSVSGDILRKPAKLTPEEWAAVKRHPVEGVGMLMRMPGLTHTTLDAMRVAFEHHMNFDRTGYPAVAQEWGQSTLSRIVAVADCFDAMTSHRAYQMRPPSAFEALQFFLGPHRVGFDPAVLWALVHTTGLFPAGSLLETASGHILLSLSPNVFDLRRPHCRVLVLPGGDVVPDDQPLLWTPMPRDERVVRVMRPEEFPVPTGELLAA
jgi:HD-GYP domain-containing protein (c-di-GMP phosphodiesterase class II)